MVVVREVEMLRIDRIVEEDVETHVTTFEDPVTLPVIVDLVTGSDASKGAARERIEAKGKGKDVPDSNSAARLAAVLLHSAT